MKKNNVQNIGSRFCDIHRLPNSLRYSLTPKTQISDFNTAQLFICSQGRTVHSTAFIKIYYIDKQSRPINIGRSLLRRRKASFLYKKKIILLLNSW